MFKIKGRIQIYGLNSKSRNHLMSYYQAQISISIIYYLLLYNFIQKNYKESFLLFNVIKYLFRFYYIKILFI
jgi:hypothetical protein